MKKSNFLIIVFVILNLNLFAQISSSLKESEVQILKKTAEQQVRGFYSDLDLIGNQAITNAERTKIISQILISVFGNKQVYIVNDIDLTKKQPKIVESGTYLNNIRLYNGNSNVSFVIDSLTVSDVYNAEDDFYFIKVEVKREMIVSLNNRLIKSVENIDIYLSFIPNIDDGNIYSIKYHEDNLDKFDEVEIIDDNGLGSFTIKSIPTGATVTVDELPNLKGAVTPYEFIDYKPEYYTINLNKIGYYPFNTKVKIEANKNLEKEIHLSLIADTIGKGRLIELQRDIKNHSRRQGLWAGGTIVAAGIGTYFALSANKKYDEYLNSTDPDEITQLQETIELYDILAPSLFVVAGFCAVEFTIQTVKKGKKKKELKLMLNGQTAQLIYKF